MHGSATRDVIYFSADDVRSTIVCVQGFPARNWRERLYLDLYGRERTMGSDGTFSTIRGEKYAVRGDAETYLAGALANACVGESACENQSCMV